MDAGLGLGAIGWVRLLLLVIGGLTVVATVVGIADIVRAGRVTISDVLLMFIYLEIWAMIAIEATSRSCRSTSSSISRSQC